MLLYLVMGLLGLSCVFNITLSVLLLKKSKVKVTETYDVQALLRDLASGPGLLQISYLDRADVLLRSPRHM